MHSEGRYRSATAKHEYTMKDHLGNTRLVYSDTNNDGIITVNTEILQESHYYPFGLEFQGHYIQQSGFDYRYKYNGIERLKDLDVGIDMAYYRGMDPTTGRWMQVDPKAEAAGSMSPYSSMGNNPISQVDPNGDLPILAAAAIGAFTSVISNGINNHNRGQDFFAGAGEAALWGAASATVSGVVGAAFGNTGSLTNEIFRALTHGVTQGGLSAIQGNGFMNGALSGAVSSGVGSGIGALGGGSRELILGSGLSGGVANLLNRESFSQGLLSGIFIGAFNHAAHAIEQHQQEILWSKGLKSLLTKAKIGSNYNSEELTKLGVPKQFANKISNFTLKSTNTAEITWGRLTYTGLKLAKSDISITSRTAIWNIESLQSGHLMLRSDALKFNYAKGKTINYFYISGTKNAISYNTKFNETWGL